MARNRQNLLLHMVNTANGAKIEMVLSEVPTNWGNE